MASHPIHTRKIHSGFFFVLGAYIILLAIAFFTLPATVASHWDSNGNPNAYMPKAIGIILFPIIGLVLYGILWIIPAIDPRKKNIEEFYPTYEQFMLVLQVFFLYIFALFIIWNSGTHFSFIDAIIPAYVILIYYVGVLLSKAKPNYFIGIRTPWTLDNEKVWMETHKRVGRLLRIIAFFPLIGLISGNGKIGWMVIPLVGVMLYGVVLSYVLYRKYTKKK